jgi:hypothetical protein
VYCYIWTLECLTHYVPWAIWLSWHTWIKIATTEEIGLLIA